jgi:hypothetical protein
MRAIHMNMPVRSQDFTQPVSNPRLFQKLRAFRRKARGLAARLTQYVRFCADCYSAAVQYEDLVNLSAAELERRGIAPGDLHRHVADALPKWPGAN